MKSTIAKLLPALLLGAATATAAAQIATSSGVHLEVEEPGAPPKPGRPPKRVITAPRGAEVRAFAFSGHPFGAERAQQTMIVQTSPLDPKAAENLREDMAVMSRILQKTCSEFAAESEKVMGLDIVLHAARSRNLFIEDYGAIFTVDVNIPLKAAAKGNGKKERAEDAADEEWENARNELFGTRRQLGPKNSGGHPVREFSAEEVNQLKNDLIDALRNAANIRGLKESNWVTIVVRGRSENSFAGDEHEWLIGGGDSDGESTMVLKVRKGEIDALKKALSKDDFPKRVLVGIY